MVEYIICRLMLCESVLDKIHMQAPACQSLIDRLETGLIMGQDQVLMIN